MSTQDTKAHVAEIGVRLMNQRGFSQVTMTQIEQAAFPSDDGPECEPVDGRIYQIFVSKEDLALYWLIETMTDAFKEVEQAIEGFGQKTVKFFLLTLFEIWIQKLTRRRVFIEGLMRSLVVVGPIERRFVDQFTDESSELLQLRFISTFQGFLSIPQDDERFGERQALMLMLGGLGFVSIFWLQDRSLGFEDTYRLADAVTDLLCVTIAEGSGGAVNGALQAAADIRAIAESQSALDTLGKFLPVGYLEALPWNLVKMLYKTT